MRIHLISFLVLLFSLPGTAQNNKLQKTIDFIVNHKYLQDASISIAVIDIEKSALVAGFNSNRNLVPASSLKLISSFSALFLLGEDYRYVTELNYNGEILGDGTLEGNIYIVGSGDPSLGSSRIPGVKRFDQLLEDCVFEIRKSGITCISGDIIADESVFNSFPVSPSWQWNDLGNYYASGAWGINIHDNLYNVYFKQTPQKGGYTKLLGISPEVPGLILKNEVITGEEGSGDNAYIFGGPYEYRKRIAGTIPPGKNQFIIKGAIPDPPSFFAYHLMKKLKDEGIQVNEEWNNFPEEKRTGEMKPIIKLISPSLGELVRYTNLQSDNLVSESLLKTLGKEKGEDGSGEAGISVVKEFMASLQLNEKTMRLKDGSGLSSRNKISAFLLASFIQKLVTKYSEKKVIEYMPLGGRDGSVRSLFKNKKVQGKVWLKSGSMEDVLSYTGILQSDKGKWYSFSLIVNGQTSENRLIRPLLEDIMVSIYDLPE